MYAILSAPLQKNQRTAMKVEENTTYKKMKQTEEAFQTLKNRILLYSNLYVPDFIIYDLAKTMEEYYEENSN